MPHILLPCVLLLSLLAQAALPWTQARSAELGFNAAPYLCNLEGRAPSPEAKAHIQQLLTLAGKDIPVEDAPVSQDHCQACIMPSLAILGQDSSRSAGHNVYMRKASFPKEDPAFYVFAQGPPLGSRAPPISVRLL